MPKWTVALLVAMCLCGPASGVARSDQDHMGPSPVGVTSVADILAGDILGIPKAQAVVVGVGAIVGALAVHLVVPGDLAYLAGGVFGGLAANWWYENGGEGRLRPLLRLERATAVVDARGEPMLEGTPLGR